MSSRTRFGILPIKNASFKLVRPWNRLEFSLRLRQSASWICFALTKLRLRGFAPVGFFCSLSGLVSLRPSANPLHFVKTFSFYFCLVFAFSRTSVCFAAAVANYCPLIFGLGYFVSHRPTQKRFTCLSPFQHFASLQLTENPQFSITGLFEAVGGSLRHLVI